MKKLFMAFMAVAAIALVGCKDKNTPSGGNEGGGEQQKDTTVTPTGDDVPEGYVRILIQVPDGEECHGIYFKGSLNGSEWSGENTYVGLEKADAAPEEAIRFKAVEGKTDFFQADFKLGEAGLQGAICQRYTNDGSWQGKCKKVTFLEDLTTMEGAAKVVADAKAKDQGGWPQFAIPAGTKAGVFAMKIGGWENSECIKANEAGQAVFTMISKVALPAGTQVGITGVGLEGKGNWDHENPLIMQEQGGKWIAMCNVEANCVYKYVIKFEDEPNWGDRHGHIIAEDKGNLSMPESRQPVDEVDEWIKFDEHAQPEPFVVADHAYGLIGDAVGGWDADKYAFAYVESGEENVYQLEANNVTFVAGPFKIRENEKWDVSYGWNELSIVGEDAENFENPGDGNIQCKADATYSKVIFKFKWNGAATTDRTLEFVK